MQISQYSTMSKLMLVMLGLLLVVTVNARPKENFRIKLEEVERKAALTLNPSIDENGRQIGSNGTGRQIGSNGSGRQIGSNGTGRQIGSNGTGRQIGSNGTGRQIGSNGTGRGGTGGGIAGTGRQIGSNGTGRGGDGGVDGTGNEKA